MEKSYESYQEVRGFNSIYEECFTSSRHVSFKRQISQHSLWHISRSYPSLVDFYRSYRSMLEYGDDFIIVTFH